MSVILAKPYTDKLFNKQPTTWRVQPKLDGVRAIYKDFNLFTRTGKLINAPKFFIEKMRETFDAKTVDGELIHENQLFNPKESANLFQDVVGAVRKKIPDDRWSSISYCAFDLDANWVEGLVPYHWRLELIENSFGHVAHILTDYVDMYGDHLLFTGTPCRTVLSIPTLGYIGTDGFCVTEDWKKKAVDAALGVALEMGFEGIMLRDDNSEWCEKRTDRLLKVKPVEDAEATVVSVQEGIGKYAGMVGALICEDEQGRQFKVGTGLTDEERAHDSGYWIDRYITYKFTERTRAGMPRHPTFVAIRDYE